MCLFALSLNQVTVDRCELPPESVLELVQLAVKRETVGLGRQLGHPVAGDALDVVVGHGVITGDVVVVIGAVVALDDVAAGHVAVGLEHDMGTATQDQRQAVALAHVQHPLVVGDFQGKTEHPPRRCYCRHGKPGRVEEVVIHHLLL